MLVRSSGNWISLVIWAFTPSHYDENFDKELKVEKAVVLMNFESLPDKYIIESRMNSTLDF